MTIWISRELPLFNFKLLNILCAWIGLPCDKLWPFEFLESFRCLIRESRYIMRLNRTSVWQVMTIWSSLELSLFNFERLHIVFAWIGLPIERLWPFEFLESFRCSISSLSIYYAPESDFHLKRYDHLNFSRASVVQFRESPYSMRLNRTSVWQVLTILISREHLLFNFKRLDILCVWIGLPCDKLWPFEFLESFRCSISSLSIYYAPESNFRVTSYDHLNFSRASVV